MHFSLGMLNNRTFSKIWTTLYKTWVVVFGALNFIFKFKQVLQNIRFSFEENWTNKYSALNDNCVFNFGSFLFASAMLPLNFAKEQIKMYLDLSKNRQRLDYWQSFFSFLIWDVLPITLQRFSFKYCSSR